MIRLTWDAFLADHLTDIKLRAAPGVRLWAARIWPMTVTKLALWPSQRVIGLTGRCAASSLPKCPGPRYRDQRLGGIHPADLRPAASRHPGRVARTARNVQQPRPRAHPGPGQAARHWRAARTAPPGAPSPWPAHPRPGRTQPTPCAPPSAAGSPGTSQPRDATTRPYRRSSRHMLGTTTWPSTGRGTSAGARLRA